MENAKEGEVKTTSSLWILSDDLLGCLFSEWLDWKDLSALDCACLGPAQRAAWLSVLSLLKVTRKMDAMLSREQWISFYAWLGSRHVLAVEGFTVRLCALEELLAALDYESVCPLLRSIEIDNDLDSSLFPIAEARVLQENLCLLLQRCSHHLSAVRVYGSIQEEGLCLEIDQMVLSSLIDLIPSKTLTKIEVFLYSSPVYEEITVFLGQHASTLKELVLDDCSGSSMPIDNICMVFADRLLSLTRLTLGGQALSAEAVLAFLSVVGGHLEILEVGVSRSSSGNAILPVNDELLLGIGQSCPKLTLLHLKTCISFANERVKDPRVLYELCPHLKFFILESSYYTFNSIFIKVDDKKREVSFKNYDMETMEEKENWMECLRGILERTQYSLFTGVICTNLLTQRGVWALMKAKLSPYLSNLDAVMSEDDLVDLVKELPRLASLSVQAEGNKFGDASLAAIAEYGHNLKDLSIFDFDSQDLCGFSDEMLSRTIDACSRLETLKIPAAGCKTILAVRNHSKLKDVWLSHVREDEATLNSLLLSEEEESKWSPSLTRAIIKGSGAIFHYVPKMAKWLDLR